MGNSASREAAVLDAIQRNDVRKLRQVCSSNVSPAMFLSPLTAEALRHAFAPPFENSKPPPSPPARYEAWIGSAPLHIAATLTGTSVLTIMLQLLGETEGITSDMYSVRDAASLTPLSRAVRASNLNAINVLLDAGVVIEEVHCDGQNESAEPFTWSHLRYAAACGLVQVLKLLLQRGADADSWGRDGKRPVHLAVEAGHLECVKVLLERDQAIDKDIERPIRAVSKYFVRECTVPAQENDAGEMAAAVLRDMEGAGTGTGILNAMQVALQDAMRGLAATQGRAAAQRTSTDRGASLLHLACSHSRPRVLKFLLSFDIFASSIEEMNDSGKTAVFMAIRHGSLECLELLVSTGARLDARDIENWTTLHEAVKAGDERIEILSYLLGEHNFDVNVVDDDGWTPLHVAARFSSTKAVDILIKAGCDVNARTEDKQTALLLASAQATSAEVFRQLLANGADLSLHRDMPLTPGRLILGRKDFNQLCILLDHLMTMDERTRLEVIDLESSSETGDTLLHVCVHEQNLGATTRLLAVGVEPDMKNHEGVGAIHITCKNGNVEIVEALLSSSADPNLVRGDGMMPLHIACDSGKVDIVKVLIQHGADMNQIVSQQGRYQGFSPLMFAARLGHEEIISILIEAGAQLNRSKADGFTALHLAAINGNIQACRCLVEAGADYSIADETGYSPLQLATRHNNLDVVRVLLESSVEPNSYGSLGLTSLHIASFICDAHLIWLLIRGGADVNVVNDDNATPLHIAAGREQGRVSMQLLLVNGARSDVVDNEQDTPLHNACYKGLSQNVRLLLRRGADPSPANRNNVTPLHLAAAAGSEETVEALLKYGADVNARDVNKKTPYRVAAERKHRKVMILLFRVMTITLDEIAPMETFAYSGEKGAENVFCVICQNSLISDEETRTLPCLHTYHDECIMGWFGGEKLTSHDSCPLCQRSVLPESTSPYRPRQ